MKKYLLLLPITLFSSLCLSGVFLENLPQTDKIFRGRAPKTAEIKKIVNMGINSVLIFKNQTKTEVDEEISQLLAAGFDSKKIHHVPFQWKNFDSEELACEQVIDALKILTKVQNSSKDKILFHCTVGEDRTGLLAGLFAQLLTTESLHDAYQNQMCQKGYAGGNKAKPIAVQKTIDRYLTPLFLKISEHIQSGHISLENLTKNVCKDLSVAESNLKPCSDLIP